jgi:Family of unknown function (DUF6062)
VRQAVAHIQRLAQRGQGRTSSRWRQRASNAAPATILRHLRAPAIACPACQIGTEAQERYTATLIRHMEDPDIRTALAGSSFLCLPDLLVALEFTRTDAQTYGCLDLMEAKLSGLLIELDELIRKRDYRFQNEPRGKEQTSWWRAIRQLVGWPEEQAPWSA